MESKTIVAIEIASSKIKGGVAAVGPDGRMTVLAIEEIPAVGNVRYGRVRNIREVSGLVNEIVRKLEKAPAVAPHTIQAAAVSLGGRSLSAVPAKSGLKFPAECEITENHIERLRYEAEQNAHLDKAIVEVVPRIFYVNRSSVPKAVGTFGETVQGEFMFVVCGKETPQNLARLKFDKIAQPDVKLIVRPTAIADLVLTPEERELGCALVDFGAETTTVAVYKDGTLAFLSVIPMGSRLITLDLMSGLGLTEEAAENYKITLGNLAEGANADNANAQEVNAYVRARAGEIAANILNQIERSAGNCGGISKIVLVGGGARLPEFATLLNNQCKMPVRVAEMPSSITFRIPGRNNAANIDIVSILAAGARQMPDSCLAEPETVPEPVPFEDEGDNGIDDEPVITVEEPVRGSHRPAAVRDDEPRGHHGRAVRRDFGRDEDEDLLKDDPENDEDEEYEETKGRRRGFSFFGLGGKKKKKDPEEEEYEEDEYDEEDGVPYNGDEDEEEEEFEPEPDDRRKNENPEEEARRKLGSLRDKFVSFFTATDIEED